MSVKTITDLINGNAQIPASLASDTAAYCTDCTKAIYSTIVNDVPELSRAGYDGLLQQQCGASFTGSSFLSIIFSLR